MNGKFRGDIGQLARHIAAHVLQAAFPVRSHPLRPPHVGMIFGTGWDEMLSLLSREDIIARISYNDIFGLGEPGVEGHKGEIVFAEINQELCVCFCGRVHLNEGRVDESAARVRLMVEILRHLCATERRFLVTNAAGAYNPEFKVGDVMVVTGFFDPYGQAPTTHPREGFYHSYKALHPHLIETALDVGRVVEKLTVHKGTFVWTMGPHLGGPANVRIFRGNEVDTVGMSGWPEICAMSLYKEQVLFCNCVSDLAWEETTHEENLARVRAKAPQLLEFIEGNVRAWQAECFRRPDK